MAAANPAKTANMTMRKAIGRSGAIALIAWVLAVFTWSQLHAQTRIVSSNVAICDPANPTRCVAPAADGSIPTTGAAGGTAVTAASGAFADGFNPTIGTTSDTATTPSLIGLLTKLNNTSILPVPGAVTTAAPSYTTGTTQALSLTTAGGLRIDGSGVTQPVSAASLPLPTGAATSANQPAVVTSGSTTSGQSGNLGYFTTCFSTANPYNGGAGTNTVGNSHAPCLTNFGAILTSRGTQVITSTPTVSTSTTYNPGVVVGGLGTFTTGVAQGTLKSLSVISRNTTANTGHFTALLFHTNPATSTFTNNSTPTVSAGDNVKLLKAIELTEPISGYGGGTIWSAQNLNYSLIFSSYYVVILVKSGTFTTSASASDMQIVTSVEY